MDFLRGEFIGKNVEIIDSSNKDLIGIKGKIVDETKNMIEVENSLGAKKVQKKICKFKFLPEKLVVEGKIIDCRPEDRISRKFKDW
ncbi:MAG: ribonuclease P protein subunit [Candidatus Aenigmatarchaeota archaeon]|nr:MAG: ribonuclease P protein subunit [Candidatus Aenigmarchaeota archaeon]